jgi:hypothetical protein
MGKRWVSQPVPRFDIRERRLEVRASDYGNQKNPPEAQMTPEQWIAEEKLMPGALQGYRYAEDSNP